MNKSIKKIILVSSGLFVGACMNEGDVNNCKITRIGEHKQNLKNLCFVPLSEKLGSGNYENGLDSVAILFENKANITYVVPSEFKKGTIIKELTNNEYIATKSCGIVYFIYTGEWTNTVTQNWGKCDPKDAWKDTEKYLKEIVEAFSKKSIKEEIKHFVVNVVYGGIDNNPISRFLLSNNRIEEKNTNMQAKYYIREAIGYKPINQFEEIKPGEIFGFISSNLELRNSQNEELMIPREPEMLNNPSEALGELLLKIEKVAEGLSGNEKDIFLIMKANKLIEEVEKYENSRNIPEFKELFLEIDKSVKNLDELINPVKDSNSKEFFPV